MATLALLSRGIRLAKPSSVPTRHISRWTRPRKLFDRSPVQGKRALWLLPVVGGLALSLYPREQPVLPALFASPTIMPVNRPAIEFEAELDIMSPNEERTIIGSVLQFLRIRIWEPILTGGRFIHLMFLFTPVICTSFMLLVGTPKKHKGDRWGAVWWYGFLVGRMEAAGPTFIKLAQWAGSRADLFPSELCRRLGSLHSNGKPHSFAHTKRVIESVFQKPFEEVFEHFQEEPIGTGAIAQVYKATLKKDLIPPTYLGPRKHKKMNPATLALQDPPPSVPTAAVAIKILHPHMSKTISRDLAIMGTFAGFLSLFPGMEWLSLPDEVEVFGMMMFQQLDLRHEAENLLTFETKFAPRNVPVTFPRPLKVWSAKNLLVEEFENALPLETFLEHGGGPYDEMVATVGLDAFLNMLLLDNFLHSDLHPGNIMIKFTKPPTTKALLRNVWQALVHSVAPSTSGAIIPPDFSESDEIVSKLRTLSHDGPAWREELGKLHDEGYIPEIVFIDAGLVTTLSATNRENFLDLFKAIAQFDGYRTGQLMVERCRSPELAVDPETFALKIQHLVLSVKRKSFSLGNIKISDVLTEVLKAVRDHHVKMEADFVNTVISILLLEGIGRQLDPELDLFKSALPILRQLGRQMSTQEGISTLPSNNLGVLIKVWVWMEARDLISSAIINADAMVKYDWLTSSS